MIFFGVRVKRKVYTPNQHNSYILSTIAVYRRVWRFGLGVLLPDERLPGDLLGDRLGDRLGDLFGDLLIGDLLTGDLLVGVLRFPAAILICVVYYAQ